MATVKDITQMYNKGTYVVVLFIRKFVLPEGKFTKFTFRCLLLIFEYLCMYDLLI